MGFFFYQRHGNLSNPGLIPPALQLHRSADPPSHHLPFLPCNLPCMCINLPPTSKILLTLNPTLCTLTSNLSLSLDWIPPPSGWCRGTMGITVANFRVYSGPRISLHLFLPSPVHTPQFFTHFTVEDHPACLPVPHPLIPGVGGVTTPLSR